MPYRHVAEVDEFHVRSSPIDQDICESQVAVNQGLVWEGGYRLVAQRCLPPGPEREQVCWLGSIRGRRLQHGGKAVKAGKLGQELSQRLGANTGRHPTTDQGRFTMLSFAAKPGKPALQALDSCQVVFC